VRIKKVRQKKDEGYGWVLAKHSCHALCSACHVQQREGIVFGAFIRDRTYVLPLYILAYHFKTLLNALKQWLNLLQ